MAQHNDMHELVGAQVWEVSFPSPYIQCDTKEQRAFRLLAEAKERHPEWVVKKLQKPLDDSPGV